mgnify:CR=1 FL=1
MKLILNVLIYIINKKTTYLPNKTLIMVNSYQLNWKLGVISRNKPSKGPSAALKSVVDVCARKLLKFQIISDSFDFEKIEDFIP